MSAEETRQRILRESSRLFAEGGFAGTSTRALARAAEVNVATLAWHFGDKRGLYHAVLDAMYESLLEMSFPERLPGDPEARVRLFARTAFAFARENQDTVRLLMRHVIDTSELPEPVRDRWTLQLLDGEWEPLRSLGFRAGAEWRLPLLSLNHLVVRYAISQPEDVGLFTDVDDPMDAVARHIEDVACLLLLPVMEAR